MKNQLFILFFIITISFLSTLSYAQSTEVNEAVTSTITITSTPPEKGVKPIISEQAREYYMIGARSLKMGEQSLTKVKQALNNAFKLNKVTLMSIRELFKETQIPLADFFTLLDKTYKYPEFLRVYNILRAQSSTNLQTAYQSFDKAIKNSQGFVDAYLLKALTCLEMCWYEEAISAFRQAWKIGLEKVIVINPLEEEFEKICFGIANISLTKPEFFKDILPEKIIKKFMETKEAKLKKIEEDTFEDEKLLEIANQLLLNKFELAKFYCLSAKKSEAQTEFKNVYNEELEQMLMYESEKYAQANREIEILESNIKSLSGEVTLYFNIDKSLLDAFKLKTNLIFFKESVLPASVDDLIIYLMPTQYKVEIKNEGTYLNINQETLRVKLPHGTHICLIQLPHLEILENNKIPFGISLENKERKYYDRLFPQMELKIALRDGRMQTINLRQGEYTWNKEGSLINNNTGETCKLKRGPFSANIVASKINLFAGEGEYNLKIEKLGKWEVKVGQEASYTFSKYSLGLMGVLLFAIR